MPFLLYPYLRFRPIPVHILTLGPYLPWDRGALVVQGASKKGGRSDGSTNSRLHTSYVFTSVHWWIRPGDSVTITKSPGLIYQCTLVESQDVWSVKYLDLSKTAPLFFKAPCIYLVYILEAWPHVVVDPLLRQFQVYYHH